VDASSEESFSDGVLFFLLPRKNAKTTAPAITRTPNGTPAPMPIFAAVDKPECLFSVFSLESLDEWPDELTAVTVVLDPVAVVATTTPVGEEVASAVTAVTSGSTVVVPDPPLLKPRSTLVRRVSRSNYRFAVLAHKFCTY